MKTKKIISISAIITFLVIIGFVIAQETTNSLNGNIDFNSNQCTKEQVIWFRENYGNINPKVYWDREINMWEMAFYKDNGEIFEIRGFKNDYGFPRQATREEKTNKLLSDEKKQEYAEYYACVWMRRVYEKYAHVQVSRPETLEINIDLSKIELEGVEDMGGSSSIPEYRCSTNPTRIENCICLSGTRCYYETCGDSPWGVCMFGEWVLI